MAATQRAVDATQEVSSSGAFVRTASTFRGQISADSSTEFPAAPGRYLVYVSLACPWACRVLTVRALKGLEHAIDVAIVAPRWERTRPADAEDTHRGWVFATGDEVARCTPDPVFGARTLREVYEKAEPHASVTKFTVPVLLDKQTRRIVNNESSDIIRMLNTEFNAFAKHPELDFYPAALRDQIDAINAHVYDTINNGVYKAGFAKSQAAYDEAVTALFAALEKYDALLATQRYLCGDTLTEADIRLFQTLVRFDAVYVCYFKTNIKMLREFRHLHAYMLDLYQTPGLGAEVVDIHHIKQHYFRSHPALNPYEIVPAGPHVDFSAPHGRGK